MTGEYRDDILCTLAATLLAGNHAGYNTVTKAVFGARLIVDEVKRTTADARSRQLAASEMCECGHHRSDHYIEVAHCNRSGCVCAVFFTLAPRTR